MGASGFDSRAEFLPFSGARFRLRRPNFAPFFYPEVTFGGNAGASV